MPEEPSKIIRDHYFSVCHDSAHMRSLGGRWSEDSTRRLKSGISEKGSHSILKNRLTSMYAEGALDVVDRVRNLQIARPAFILSCVGTEAVAPQLTAIVTKCDPANDGIEDKMRSS